MKIFKFTSKSVLIPTGHFTDKVLRSLLASRGALGVSGTAALVETVATGDDKHKK